VEDNLLIPANPLFQELILFALQWKLARSIVAVLQSK
jgi:hypothetical protein